MHNPVAVGLMLTLVGSLSARAHSGEKPVGATPYSPVTVTELDALARQAFESRDRNGDANISFDEVRADRSSFGGGNKGWALDVLDPVRWTRSDRDYDGLVTSYEVAERYRTRFEDLDRDGDGVLTHAEWLTGQEEELRYGCTSATSCAEIAERERWRQRMLEQRGRAFERLDWTARSYYRQNSSVAQPLYTEVRDYRSWHGLWDRIVSASGRKPPTPAVDFSQHMLLVAAMGTRPTGGYSIQIVSVQDNGRELIATAVQTSPGKRCGATAAITHPLDIVKVAANRKKVRWEVRNRATACKWST
jgi:hypothetical protein